MADSYGQLFYVDAGAGGAWIDRLRYRPITAERRLCIAILEMVMNDLKYETMGHRADDLRDDALAWLQDDRQSEWVFSFQRVCDCLGLNPSAVRKTLLATRAIVPRSPRPNCYGKTFQGFTELVLERLRHRGAVSPMVLAVEIGAETHIVDSALRVMLEKKMVEQPEVGVFRVAES